MLPDPIDDWKGEGGKARPEPTEERPCEKCGDPVAFFKPSGLSDDLRAIFERIPAVCQKCVPKAREEIAASVPAVETTGEVSEQWVRDSLAAIGLNSVEAHGLRDLEAVLPKFDAKVQRAMRDFVRELPGTKKRDPVQGVFLYGPVGGGKTLLCGSLLRHCLTSRMFKPSELCFISLRLFIGDVKSGYGSGMSSELVHRAIRAKLLVMDELGAEHATEDSIGNLTEIMSGREQRPTLITSNLKVDDIGDRYSENANAHIKRLSSRLQIRNFRTVVVIGDDHRLAKAG